MAARKKTARPGSRKAKAAKAAASPAEGPAPLGKDAKPRKGARSAARAGAKGKARRGARGAPAAATQADAAPSEATSFPQIVDLAGLMDRFDLLEVRYRVDPDGGTEIHVSRRGHGAPSAGHAPQRAHDAAPAAHVPAADPAPPANTAPPAADASLVPFKSPMVGTFYRAPSPEAQAFASVGDKVDPSSVVCIIEAMKVMNEIHPDVSGEIVSIEVENGEAVEFGQTLMLLRSR